MSAGARVVDSNLHSFAPEAVLVNSHAPGLVGIPNAGPFANPLMQHCPGAISAPQLLNKIAPPRDESSRDVSEGSGTHVLTGSPIRPDDAGVEQAPPRHVLAREGEVCVYLEEKVEVWGGGMVRAANEDDVEDITRMLMQDSGAMIETGGTLDDLFVGPLGGAPRPNTTMEEDLRGGELLFELEPYAGRNKILMGEDEEEALIDDEPLLVPSSPSSRQDSCHPGPSGGDWGLLPLSGASLVSMTTTATTKTPPQHTKAEHTQGHPSPASTAGGAASRAGSKLAAPCSKSSDMGGPAVGGHRRSGSTSSPVTAAPPASQATPAAGAPAAPTPVFSSSSKFGGPCMHCGATESPQWRRGPPEKPMLCNACGTRYRRSNQLGPVPGPATLKGGVQKKKGGAAGAGGTQNGHQKNWSSGSRPRKN